MSMPPLGYFDGEWLSCSDAHTKASTPSTTGLFDFAFVSEELRMKIWRRAAALGLLLTGANEDGALGIARIREVGGTALVQSPRTASVPTMPEAALRLTHPDYVLDLPEIGPLLARLGISPTGSRTSRVEGAS